ncbi:unnamed protein product [Mycena citricolor]|uniref:Uncharacterized protein n=1 Tax=Mycena citricolor TaxID=2018698 RepID=A0AAD2JUZ6_9AGAR|nr:unnamed protein product [Mycena citricolor]
MLYTLYGTRLPQSNSLPHIMDKTTSVLAAFDAGKLPSTQQIHAFTEWLRESVITAAEPSSEDPLSEQGRVFAGDVRGILEAYETLLKHKNGDNTLQDAIWHITEGDVTGAVKASTDPVDKSEIIDDAQVTRDSLRALLSIAWKSVVSEGDFLLNDFASFARLTLADAAEVVQGQAGRAKEQLREIDQEVEEGKRDGLGRDKDRLTEEEGNKQAVFENGMDKAKMVGSKAISVGQTAAEKSKEVSAKTRSQLEQSVQNAIERAQSDPAYRDKVSQIFDILHKWVVKALDADHTKPFTLDELVEDPSPDRHVHQALTGFKTFINRFSAPECTIDTVLDRAQIFLTCIRGHESTEFQAWVDQYFAYAQRILHDSDYARSAEAQQVQRGLSSQWNALLNADTEVGHSWAELQQSLLTFANAIGKDEDIVQLREAHAHFGNNIARSVQNSDLSVVERAIWFWRDLFTVYTPRLLGLLKDTPITRTEYVDEEVDFVLENLDVSTFELNPAHISLRNTTEVDVQTSRTKANTTDIGTVTHIHLRAVQLALKDASFYIKAKEAGKLIPSEFSGLLALEMPPEGIDIQITIRLISSPDERAKLRRYHRIEVANVQLSEKMKISMRESNHRIALALAKPIVKKRLRDALGKTLSEQLRAGLEWLDSTAFDVARRAEVFADAGAGPGPSFISAVWSEIGHLTKGKKGPGLRFTGAGIVVEDSDKKFAMGAEPQVLSGEKHGPVAAASTRLGAANSLDKGKSQILSFKQTVEDKSAREAANSGWQSRAFDL